jgi:hypothetical protein
VRALLPSECHAAAALSTHTPQAKLGTSQAVCTTGMLFNERSQVRQLHCVPLLGLQREPSGTRSRLLIP